MSASTTNDTLSARIVAAGWRVGVAVFASLMATRFVAVPLGIGWIVSNLLSGSERVPSSVDTLAIRIATGIAMSICAIAVVYLLTRHADNATLRSAGLTRLRIGWRQFLWGVALWLAPAIVAFAVLAALGATLTVTVPAGKVFQTVVLLFFAVLLAEAIPEETIFRGYVTNALGRVSLGWWRTIFQAVLFTLFAGVLRQDWNPTELSLFFTMGIGFGYLRTLTGSIWMSVGFHTAFQTGAQLVLSHDVVNFAGDQTTAMLGVGVIPFTAAAILITTTRMPRFVTEKDAATKGGVANVESA